MQFQITEFIAFGVDSNSGFASVFHQESCIFTYPQPAYIDAVVDPPILSTQRQLYLFIYFLSGGMNRSLGSPSFKRKRPETDPPGLVDAEGAILNAIKGKKDLGIWVRDIKLETKLTDHVVNKLLNLLLAKGLVKEVVNIQSKGKKHYMAVEFEPSKEISGGEWYVDGNLDKELIRVLRQLCLRYMRAQKVATLEAVHNELKKNSVVTFDISGQQVAEILYSMVLDNDIIEVKSSGLGDCRLIPIGTICYRVARGPRIGSFASIPCGACPRISLCTPDGLISPSTCVYYTKWLDIDF